MKATIDPAGRILIPKTLRDSLGLAPGSQVDVSAYGSCVQITPGGRTARVEKSPYGHLVAVADAELTDEVLFSLIDAGRR